MNMLHLRNLFIFSVLGYVLAARTPVCYDDGGQFSSPSSVDCKSSMAYVKNSPYFNRPQRYGEYENPPRKVPLDWPRRSCLLTIDSDDGSKTDTFAIAATMPAFAALEAACVRRGPGFGGYIPIGNGKTFYAIIQYNPRYRASGASERLFVPSNRTGNGTNLVATS
ncbi:MAG: hypothetical protein LQ341_003920 [Variospora aurantia]|nr:MAG: hypothetical protein LQ341_003920 [Variospora aurantia]